MGTAVEDQQKDDVQRWTTKRKAALVLSIVKGDTSNQEAARQHGLTVAEIEDWKGDIVNSCGRESERVRSMLPF